MRHDVRVEPVAWESIVVQDGIRDLEQLCEETSEVFASFNIEVGLQELEDMFWRRGGNEDQEDDGGLPQSRVEDGTRRGSRP